MSHRLPAHTGRVSSGLRQYIQHAEILGCTSRAPQLQRRRFTTTQRRQTLDHIPRFSHSVLLPNKIIAISGPDASTFLQGLITANVSTAALEQPSSQPGPDYTAKYAGLLNAQGRIMHTFMVYPVLDDSPLAPYIPGLRSDQPYFLLDIPEREMSAVQQRLKLYKLKSKVDIYHVNDFASLALWNDSQPSGQSTLQEANPALLAAKDERAPGFGTRIIAKHESVDPLVGDTQVDSLEYARRRYQWGIPEGTTELVPKSALPHESNLDYMGAIDFRKGCYVGQELTIRTQHQGVIRKRIMPLKIEGQISEGQNFEGLDLKVAESGKRSVGKILATQGDLGLGLIRLAQAGFASEVADGEAQSDGAAGDGGVDLKVEGFENVLVRPFVPSWWKERKGVH